MEAKCSRWSEKDGGGEEKRAVVVFITVKAPPSLPPSPFPLVLLWHEPYGHGYIYI